MEKTLLIKDAGRKIYLILDNLRVHHIIANCTLTVEKDAQTKQTCG